MFKPFLLVSAALFYGAAALTSAPTLAAGQTPQAATPAPQPAMQEPVIAPSSAPPPPSTNPVKPTAASQEKAKKLFAQDCAICHGDNGSGKTDLAKDMKLTLTDWTDPKTLVNRSDQELFHIIRTGKDKMPAEEVGRAKDPEVWNLVIYIRGLSKGQPAAAETPAN
jgi:mono/diheme cytochrome c family protein